MIFDTHAHYEDKRFDEDREILLSSMIDNNIETIVNVGSSLKTCEKSKELALDYDNIYYSVGIHPSEILSKEEIPTVINSLKRLALHEKCVAIGEIGLDYYFEEDENVLAQQPIWFKKQLELAKEMDLPVIVHSREATEETFKIMAKAHENGIKAVIHCFSGSVEIAKKYVEMGYFIGVGGVVTFKNGRKLKEVVEAIPLESILLETDAPYMAPEPNRGRRNDSTMLKNVVSKISEIKAISEEEVINVTTDNAYKFYTKCIRK